MKYNPKKKEIILSRKLSKLDEFVLDFVSYLKDYVIVSGAVDSKTANGRIRVMSIEVTPIDFDGDKNTLDVHDRYRALITCEISLGKIET